MNIPVVIIGFAIVILLTVYVEIKVVKRIQSNTRPKNQIIKSVLGLELANIISFLVLIIGFAIALFVGIKLK